MACIDKNRIKINNNYWIKSTLKLNEVHIFCNTMRKNRNNLRLSPQFESFLDTRIHSIRTVVSLSIRPLISYFILYLHTIIMLYTIRNLQTLILLLFLFFILFDVRVSNEQKGHLLSRHPGPQTSKTWENVDALPTK